MNALSKKKAYHHGDLRTALVQATLQLVSQKGPRGFSMTEACRQAAESAREALGGAKPAAVIVFDCVCRGAILGDSFDQEIAALRGVFPDVPITGFLTYGEIARTGGRLDGWHNTTCVVVALPA